MARSAKDDLAGRFGENMKRARRKAGLSQEELSFRAELHRTEISQLERGLRLPRLDTIAKIAGAAETPVESLFDGVVWRPGEFTRGGFA
jgi:transcriptional regulator with XRE-family HTH domain